MPLMLRGITIAKVGTHRESRGGQLDTQTRGAYNPGLTATTAFA